MILSIDPSPPPLPPFPPPLTPCPPLIKSLARTDILSPSLHNQLRSLQEMIPEILLRPARLPSEFPTGVGACPETIFWEGGGVRELVL